MPHDHVTIDALCNGLRTVLHAKGETRFDRGAVVGRIVESVFYLMEVAGGSLYPRYKWWLPYNMNWHEAIPMIIRDETRHPSRLIGMLDNRPPSPRLNPDGDPWWGKQCPVRMTGSHDEWVQALLDQKNS